MQRRKGDAARRVASIHPVRRIRYEDSYEDMSGDVHGDV